MPADWQERMERLLARLDQVDPKQHCSIPAARRLVERQLDCRTGRFFDRRMETWPWRAIFVIDTTNGSLHRKS